MNKRKRDYYPVMGRIVVDPNAPIASHVYITSVPSGKVKIGKADIIENRLRAAQTDNPEILTLEYVVDCVTAEMAFGIENILHRHFAPYHVHGEWFKIAADEVIAFIKLILEVSSITQADTDGKFISVLKVKEVVAPSPVPVIAVKTIVNPKMVRRFNDLPSHLKFIDLEYYKSVKCGDYRKALNDLLQRVELINLNDFLLEYDEDRVREIPGKLPRQYYFNLTRLQFDFIYECAVELKDAMLAIDATTATCELLRLRQWFADQPIEYQRQQQSEIMSKIVKDYIDHPEIRTELESVIPALKQMGKQLKQSEPSLYDLPLFRPLLGNN